MIEIIIRKNGVDLIKVESNEEKIIRCIKKNRTGEPPDGGWPVITDIDIAAYAGAPIIPIGDSWDQLMRADDDQIMLEEVKANPVGATERANARIAALNDPAQ